MVRSSKYDVNSKSSHVQVFEATIHTIQKEKGLSIMESILLYCTEKNIEVELSAKLVSPALKSKLKREAMELHCLKKPKTKKPAK